MDSERNFANMDRTLNGGDGQALQHFMSNSPWAGPAVFDQIQAEIKATPALAQGSTLILDESADEKAGTHNAGASRQYNGRLGKVDVCRVDTPTVCLGVTSVVAYTYGCGDGRIGPTRCALIVGARGDRCSRCQGCRTPLAGARSARSRLAAGSRRASTAAPGGFPRSRTNRDQSQRHVVMPALPGPHLVLVHARFTLAAFESWLQCTFPL